MKKILMGVEDSNLDGETLIENQSEEEVEVDHPPMFKVILWNDNYTTMDFVVEVLVQIFHKSPQESIKIMYMVHEQGHGICGIYDKDTAETRVSLTMQAAQIQGHPLKCTMEKQ